MRILFFVRHYAYLRLFEAPIAALAERGHDVRLVSDREEAIGGRGLAERLATRYPNITLDTTPAGVPGAWGEFARRLRLGIDYLRFLDPKYASTPQLTARARERAPRVVVSLANRLSSQGARLLLASVLRSLERALPPATHIEQYIRAHRPDVVLITPLVELGSRQIEHITAAKAVGVRTILPIASWDNLSSKALVRKLPDRILVWNPVQTREAVEMHGVPESLVTVTGAQCFDQWFDRAPARTRAQFCSRVGLPPDRPYILYLCSSLFKGTANEAEFVERWVAVVRRSDDTRLKNIGILIRPHPQRLEAWKAVDLSGYSDVVFWGAMPIDEESKDDYFDSIYYASSVVGLNTSAFLEAAVVGKPVHTILDPEISAKNQEGTVHFHYLATVGGGLLRVANDLDDHLGQLATTLVEEGGGDPKAERFVEGFIRPFGRTVAATPKFVEAVEQVGGLSRPASERPGMTELLWRLLAYPMAGALQVWLGREVDRKHRRQAKAVERRARREAAAERKRLLAELKQARQAEVRAQRSIEKGRARETKRAAREERLSAWRRQKRRSHMQDRIRRNLRRLTHPFSVDR